VAPVSRDPHNFDPEADTGEFPAPGDPPARPAGPPAAVWLLLAAGALVCGYAWVSRQVLEAAN
jgi:hypothetical protein